MNMHSRLTPSQAAFYEAAKARGIRKLEAARRRTPTPQPSVQKVKAQTLALVGFSLSASMQIEWNHYRSPYFGNSEESGAKNTMDRIAARVLEGFPGVDLAKIKGRERNRFFAFPRHLILYTIHQQRSDLTFPQIARWCGGRDHTTVMHSAQLVERLIAEEKLEAAIIQWRVDADVRKRRFSK